MKQQEVFKKIGGIIQELNEQYQYLQGSENNLNDLELELFVANTHFLKDHAEILRKLNAIKSQPVIKKPTDEPKWFEPVVQPAKPVLPPAPTLFKLDPVQPKEDEPLKFELGQPEEPSPVYEFGAKKPAVPEDDAPASIDLGSETSADSYSFEREVIRHNLILDEATSDEDEDEGVAADEALLTPIAEIDTKEADNDPENSELPAEPREETDSEPELTEPEPEPVADPEPEPTPVTEPVTAAKKSVAESMEDIQIEHLRAEPTTIPVTAKSPQIQTGAELKAAEPALTLNQRFSAQVKDKKPAAQAPAEVLEPLADIKTAINLNDKLLFVKDLFRGYNLAYTEAIEIVNRFTNFEEADRFLKNNYVTKNDWESKKETADKFYALLRRRYA